MGKIVHVKLGKRETKSFLPSHGEGSSPLSLKEQLWHGRFALCLPVELGNQLWGWLESGKLLGSASGGREAADPWGHLEELLAH